MRIRRAFTQTGTRCWKVWSSSFTAVVGLCALFSMVGILDNRSALSEMIHGRRMRCFFGDSLCVWREPSGALVAGFPDRDEDRTDAFGRTVAHHACVRAYFRIHHDASLVAPTQASTHRSLLITYDDRVTTPDEVGVRAAVVAFGEYNGYPWAIDDLVAGDVTTVRILMHGYAINGAALMMLSPVVMRALRSFAAARDEMGQARRRNCALRGLCGRCKYDLRGIRGDVCPECGASPSRVADAESDRREAI